MKLKGKSNRQIDKRIFSYFKLFKSYIFLIAVCFIIITVSTFIQPLALKKIMDDGMGTQDFNTVFLYAVVWFVLTGITQGVQILQTKLFTQVHNESTNLLYSQVFMKLLKIKVSYFNNKNKPKSVTIFQAM